MIFRDYISWWFRPTFLQPWGKKSDILFAGPWLGEFGWELMNWQAFLRKLSVQYKKVIISCRPSSQAQYSDFCNDFVFHSIKGTPECNWAHDIQKDESWRQIISQIPKEADHLPTVGWLPMKFKTFKRFGTNKENLSTPLLFHPRGRNFGTDRNWGSKKWNQLIADLNHMGIRPGCIGLSSATCKVEGDFFDYRDQPLDKVFDILASTQILLGPSSGPMHLASLCGTPHLVWTDRKRYAHGFINRSKYESKWNPFNTQTIVLDEWGFDPSVVMVKQKLINFLETRTTSA